MGGLGGTIHVTSTKKRGAPVHLSGDGQPTLTSLSSPEHMTGDEDSSEDEEYSTSSALTAREPTPLGSPPSDAEAVEDDRQSAVPELDLPSIAQPFPPDQTLDSVVSEHEQEQESASESDLDIKSPVPTAQGGVPEVQKAYLQCTMDRYKYTVQSYQNWKNPLGMDRFCMFPAINQQINLDVYCKY